ncbi:hypothetical protein Bpfe_020761 [Biomphalaria pfeifferi]|uniref:Uncharacterized protein n=1 Tax=Biomphalaria pfeifferi TaxID=112525 RepID=A0AAD8B9L2_BIOPF|nr:hypothetical protein Bpfe_020761 [Biomphalaria pfeifferi]
MKVSKLKQSEEEYKQLLLEKSLMIENLQEKVVSCEMSQIITKEDKKTYSSSTRIIIYHCLELNVPVDAIAQVLRVCLSVIGINFEDLPTSSTISQMAREMGVIAELQVAEAIIESEAVTLSFDATTIKGSHINEVHFSTKEQSLTASVTAIPGGKTEDYVQHVKDTIDGIAHEARKALSRLNSAIPSAVFGSDCRAANLLYAISKLRYKAKGDPSEFKQFLKNHSLSCSTFPGYVGNRLYVLFYGQNALSFIRRVIAEPDFVQLAEHDAFGRPLMQHDETLIALHIVDHVNIEQLNEVINKVANATLTVILRQYERYIDGNLSSLTNELMQAASSAPAHNIWAKRTLGLFDAMARRAAPNAEITYVDGKAKAKVNKSLNWLYSKSITEQDNIVKFSIARANTLRSLAKTRRLRRDNYFEASGKWTEERHG